MTARWFVPAVSALALLFCATDIGSFLSQLIGMPFHELGHAVFSWLGGHAALPLPFFTFWLEERSFWVTLLCLALAAFVAHACRRERCWFGVGVAFGFALATAICSWALDDTQSRMLQVLGGPLGEALLPWLCLVLFTFPLPSGWRWDFWRFPVAGVAAFAFAHSFWLWQRGAVDPSSLPWGSVVGDASDGDLNRLIDGFGFTTESLVGLLLGATRLGLVGLALACAWPFVEDELARRGLLPEWLAPELDDW